MSTASIGYHLPRRKKKEIQNLSEALTFFLDKIGGRFLRAEQGAKGPICFVLSDPKGAKTYLFFKRDWLHSYEYLFPGEMGKGWGQTVNYAVLKKAANEDGYILVATPRGFLYVLEAAEWLRYAEEHKTIRRPSEEIGLEASIPSTMVRRVELKD